MGAEIDSLEIGIQTSAVQAEKALDSLVTKLKGISTQLGITSNSLGHLSGAVNNLTRAMAGFKDSNIKASDFTRIFNGVEKISTLDSSAVNQVAGSVNNLLKNVSGIGNIKFDSQKFNEMANSISKLGRTSVTEATQNLEFLKTSLSDFITGLNGVGTLNFNPGSLAQLVSSISRIGGKNATQAVQNLPLISKALRDFITGMNSVGSVTFGFDGLNNLVNSIARLGGTKATQAVASLKPIKDQILRFVSGLNGIGALKFDVTGLANLVSSITKLGGKAATTAIPNIQQLGVALSQLMKTLSQAPMVSQNLIQMTNALAKLASNGSRVSSASKTMQNSLNGYSAGARRASNSTKGLASQIGMFYAKCFMLIRGVKALWKAINSSMDYIETLNYFDAAWGQVADNAVKNWKEAGYDSAEEYADSFAKRAQELTGKLSGFTADESGNLVSTGMPSLGLDPERVMNYQATFGQMASSMGVASETAAKLSQALTQIGADLASVKNLKFEDVWDDMASGMVGMSRTLDKYGVNIRNVNLQEKLYELGIDTKIAKLGQQDKALLRTIILLESTKYAWGDMADTIGQPANQLRLLQANFANLARTIGNLFLPIVAKVLPYINALVIALQRLFAWLGGLLGIKVGGFSTSIGSGAASFEDMEESADGIADSTGDAAKNTKKMRDYLMGIDELNVLSNDEDKSSGSGSTGGGVGDGLLDDAFNDALAEYQAAWDAAFANMENRSQEMADKMINAFQRIGKAIEPTTEALKRLWNEGLSRLGNFSWTALKDFYTEFLVPLGKWTLGKGLPRFINITNDFLKSVNWKAINEALKSFWKALAPFSKNVGEGLIDFYQDLTKIGSKFINSIVPSGLNGLASALKKISPSTARNIGYALGELVLSLSAFQTVKTISKNIGELTTKFGKFFKVTGAVKYTAIALGIGGVIIALDKFGYINVDWEHLWSGLGKVATALSDFAIGIGEGLITFISGLLNVLSPTLESLVNGFANALDGIGMVLSAIPESLISGVANALLSLFLAFQAHKAVVVAGGLLSSFASNLSLFASVLPGVFNSGPILKNLALALGPTALGGIQFTLIAGGLLAIANHINKVTTEAAKNSAIGEFSQAIRSLNDEVSSKTSEIQNSLANTKSAIENAGVAETAVARDLAAQYNELSTKVSLSADEKSRLAGISSELIDIIPELSKYIDDENGYLDIQKKSLDAVIDGYESLAQKQAAQEYLVQAYKNQYEAQMNLKNAQDSYNKAFEENLKSAGLAPTIIQQIRDNQLDLNQAYIDFEKSPDAFAEKYGVDSVWTLKKAIGGLNEEMDVYYTTLSDAQQTVVDANSNLDSMKEIISEADKKIAESIETEKEAILASDEYKQSLRDLQTTFSNLDLDLSDALTQGLALEGFDPSTLEQFFSSLSNEVQASSTTLKEAFENLGLTLPDDLARSLSTKEPELQADAVRLLMSIQSGVQASEETLKLLFTNLGITLPDNLVFSLSTKEENVQMSAVNLLSKIQNGFSLQEGNLKTLFSTLGITLPEALITSLASKDADIQAQAINLLGQLSTATDSERPRLISEFNSLGAGVADEGLIKALTNKTNDLGTATNEMVRSGITDPLEASLKSWRLGDGSKVGLEVGKSITDSFGVGGADNADSAMTVIANAIVESGSNKHSDFEGLGVGWAAYSAEGFKNEITKQVPSTEAVMQSFAKNGIINPFTLYLGIHSPSTVFQEHAADTINGYNKGIELHYNTTKTFIETWSKAITKWFKDAFGLDSGGVVPKEWASNIVKAFNSSIESEYSTSQAFIEKWAEGVRNWFTGKDVTSGVNEPTWTDFAKKIVTAFNVSIETEHTSGIKNMQNWAKHIKEWFWGTENFSSTDGLYDDFYNMAKRINEGFAKGIDDFAHLAKSAIKKWASEAMEAAEEEFDINSPSKRFYRMGTYDIQGFVNAIKKMAPISLTEISEWASGVSGTFANGLEFAAPQAYEFAYVGDGYSQSKFSTRNEPFNVGGIRELIDFDEQKELLIEQNAVLREQNEILTQLLEKDTPVVIGGREIVNVYDSTKRRSGYPVRK